MFRPFRALANWSVGVLSVMAYDPGWRFAPRVALRSTLGYLILPRWGGGMMVHRTRSDGLLYQRDGRDRWFIERNPMVLCPNGAQGDSPGQSEALVVPTIADRCIEEAFEASCGGVDPQFGEDFARDVSKHRQISTARRA